MPIGEEIELKYLLLQDSLAKAIDLKSLRCDKITQSYFSEPHIKKYLIPSFNDILSEPLPVVEYTNGRVRASTGDEETRHTMTIKGPRQDGIARLEVEEVIPYALYTQLLSFADEGAVVKERHYLPGRVECEDGVLLEVTAEMDVMVAAADTLISSSPAPAFAVVEIELANRKGVASLQAGRHSFDFLKTAVPILDLEPWMQRIIRMRYFAQHGFDDRVARVLAQVFKL